MRILVLTILIFTACTSQKSESNRHGELIENTIQIKYLEYSIINDSTFELTFESKHLKGQSIIVQGEKLVESSSDFEKTFFIDTLEPNKSIIKSLFPKTWVPGHLTFQLSKDSSLIDEFFIYSLDRKKSNHPGSGNHIYIDLQIK